MSKKLWDDSDKSDRFYMLSSYFKTAKTIKKHIDKQWSELPSNFKKHINKEINKALQQIM